VEIDEFPQEELNFGGADSRWFDVAAVVLRTVFDGSSVCGRMVAKFVWCLYRCKKGRDVAVFIVWLVLFV
jgi:hypothetical protein